MFSNEQPTILLVEDDPADQKLIRSSIEKQETKYDLYTMNSAEQALECLHSNGENGGAYLRPDLILLDLNMPGKGGKKFLQHI